MKINTSLKHLLICATSVMALASCGGGNDVASGGAGTGVTSASAVTAGASNSAASTSITSTKAAMDRIGGTTPAWVIQSFQTLFPNNPAGYTAQSLSDALAVHNVFAGQNAVQQVYNYAAFLANSAHETGNYLYMTELGNYGGPTNWSTNGQGIFSGSYAGCQGPPVPPGYGGTGTICYYGRGALQISHDYNYQVYGANNGAFANPNIILGSGAPNYTNNLLFDSGVWFWSDDSTGLQKLRPMDGFLAATNTYATSDPFGQSIKVINGGIECGGGVSPQAQTEAQDRINKFITYLPVVASAAGVQLISGYSTAKDGTIGVACTATPAGSPFTLNIINKTANYIGIGLQDQSWNYRFVGAGDIAVAPNATVTVGTTSSGQKLVSTTLNGMITASGDNIVRVTYNNYTQNQNVVQNAGTPGGWTGILCASLAGGTQVLTTFLPNTTRSITLNADLSCTVQ
jgi:predicted chitinase